MNQPRQGGWREIQEDSFNSSSCERGSRPRAKSQRITEISSSNRVRKSCIPRSTHNEVKHHENTLSQPLLQMPRLSPLTIVVQSASPTPVLRRRRSLSVFRGSQNGPGSSSSQHESSRLTRNGDPKGPQKFAFGSLIGVVRLPGVESLKVKNQS
ncbi:predicted protein [Botrytis cinerea T4]|uniref:Uncharacterized protein n=1 Tax=Botryotinia fuckeliana (strain T4) TaxID=999810 RepID=G2YFW8_BOTF4|nr:predicted protein [Botrytis cinerea T4]